MCRGTASTAPLVGFIHNEWEPPSRYKRQPCLRTCCSGVLRFIQQYTGYHVSASGAGTEAILAAISENQGNCSSEALSSLLLVLPCPLAPGISGEYAMCHSPSRSKIAVNSLCMATPGSKNTIVVDRTLSNIRRT